jgi:hypothetical protein
MPNVPPGNFAKSFYYDEPLHSEAASSDVSLSLGQAFLLEGLQLKEATYSDGYAIRLSPGSFVSNGVAVEIAEEVLLQIPQEVVYSGATRIPSFFIYGYTDNGSANSPVHVSFKLGGLMPAEALIGVFYPGVVSAEAIFNADDNREAVKTWKWMPAPSGKITSLTTPNRDISAHFDDLGKQWTKTDINVIDADPDVSFFSTYDWAYRYDMKLPTDDDLHGMFFSNGRLLIDGVDYLRESPGTFLVWGKTVPVANPYFTGVEGASAADLTNGAFACLFTENITWRHEEAFNGEDNSTVQIPAGSLAGVRSGSISCLVFTDGFLLSPDRYTLDTDTGVIAIKPRVDFNGDSYFVSDQPYTDSGFLLNAEAVISHITVVGVKDLVGIDNVANEVVVDGVEPVSSTSFLGVPGSNDSQVWVNGRLTHPDHGWSNTSHSAFDIYPDSEATENGRQGYSGELSVDRLQVGALPLTSRKLTEYAAYYAFSQTNYTEAYNSMVAVRFAGAGTGQERLLIKIKPDSFEELDLIGSFLNHVGRAIFNAPYLTSSGTLSSDHWAATSDPRVFFNESVGEEFTYPGSANYFVTYDYLMGFTTDPVFPTVGYIMPGYDVDSGKWPVKGNSVFSRLRVELMEDMPPNAGLALQGAIELKADGDIGGDVNNREPRTSADTSLKSATGRYDKHVDPSTFFSDLNPMTNLAAVDSFMNKFAESFGFVLGGGGQNKELMSAAGVTYDSIGAILKSFGAQLGDDTRRTFSIGDTDALTDVIEKMAGLGLSDIGFGWGGGYMWSNQFFDMETGTFSHDPWSAVHHYRNNDYVYAWHYEDRRNVNFTSNKSVNVWGGHTSQAYSDSFKHVGATNNMRADLYDKGFYSGNVGFLRPDEPPLGSAVWPFNGPDNTWADTNGDLLDGGIVRPSSSYPGTSRGPRGRDGVPSKYPNSESSSAGITNYEEHTDGGWLGGDSDVCSYKSHFRVGDRVYDHNKGTIHNHHITINPVHQLYDLGLSHYTEEKEGFFGNSRADILQTQMQYTRDLRRFTHFFKEKNDKFGFNIYGHNMSLDIAGHGRYNGTEYTNGSNYWGMSNILTQFFIFGPTNTSTPLYVNSGNSTENFYTSS